MASRGAPSKFEKVKGYLLEMAKYGLTDKQMADVVGVTEQTINNWKSKDKDFFEALKESKSISDDRVVRSLYEKAIGYECYEEKIFNNDGEPLIVPTIKHYPPDTTAIIYWLKNRQPDKWRDKPVEENEQMTVTIVNDLGGSDD